MVERNEKYGGNRNLVFSAKKQVNSQKQKVCTGSPRLICLQRPPSSVLRYPSGRQLLVVN